jgi:hypothetical protein
MDEQETLTYLLAAYSENTRWNGELTIPTQRRLSDYLNNDRVFAFPMTSVVPSTWENNVYRSHSMTEAMALLKRNIHIVVPHTDPPPPPTTAIVDRIRKVPFRLIVHMPTFTIVGELNLLPNADWLFVLAAANEEFFAMTKATLYHTQTQTQLEPNRNFMLINRQAILALEPIKPQTTPSARTLLR